jgi:hypothetical protein
MITGTMAGASLVPIVGFGINLNFHTDLRLKELLLLLRAHGRLPPILQFRSILALHLTLTATAIGLPPSVNIVTAGERVPGSSATTVRQERLMIEFTTIPVLDCRYLWTHY